MCEFVSWVEHEDKLYYLTANLLNTKEGRALKKFLAALPCVHGTQYYEDIKGHGAIERYFGISGKHYECTDFSSPKNFPAEIVKALKAGAFRGIGISARRLRVQARCARRRLQVQARCALRRLRVQARCALRRLRVQARCARRRLQVQARSARRRLQVQAR